MNGASHGRALKWQALAAATLLDSSGRERLQIGLKTDGAPAAMGGGRDVPFVIPEASGLSPTPPRSPEQPSKY